MTTEGDRLYSNMAAVASDRPYLWAEEAHFKLGCVGKLAFKGDQLKPNSF